MDERGGLQVVQSVVQTVAAELSGGDGIADSSVDYFGARKMYPAAQRFKFASDFQFPNRNQRLELMKAIVLCVLLGLVLVSAVDTTKGDEKEKRVDLAKKRMAAKGVTNFDVSKLDGKWFQISGSSALHENFLKDCRCNSVDFNKLTDNKYLMKACCKGKDNKDIRVNGTLSQVKDNKALFQLEFTGKTSGDDIKGVEVNKTETREVQKIAKEGKDDAHDTQAKGKSGGSGNVVMLRVGKDYNYIVMGSPALDSCWILSRKVAFDDKEYNDIMKFLDENGFTSSKLIKINHEGCDAVQKGK